MAHTIQDLDIIGILYNSVIVSVHCPQNYVKLPHDLLPTALLNTYDSTLYESAKNINRIIIQIIPQNN